MLLIATYVIYVQQVPLFMIAAMHFSHLPSKMFKKMLITEWWMTKSVHTTRLAIAITQFWFIYNCGMCVCVLWAPAGGRDGTWFPPAMPAGAPVLNKVNCLIGSEQVKAQPVVITLCMGCFFSPSMCILSMCVGWWALNLLDGENMCLNKWMDFLQDVSSCVFCLFAFVPMQI